MLGAQCGLKPDEVLDMNVDMFNAFVSGYTEHLHDLQVLSVYTGYWAGYYGGGVKRPKKLDYILSIMERSWNKSRKKNSKDSKDIREPDVEGFLAMETSFKERKLKLKPVKDGEQIAE